MPTLLAKTLLVAGLLSTLRNVHALESDHRACAYFRGPNPLDGPLDPGRFDHGPLLAWHILAFSLGVASIWAALALGRGKREDSAHVSLWSGAGALGYAAAVYAASAYAFRSHDSLRTPLSVALRAEMIGSVLLDAFCGALALTVLLMGARRSDRRARYGVIVTGAACVSGALAFMAGR